MLLLLAALITQPPPYTTLKQRIEADRLRFTARYASADSADRIAVVDSARNYLFDRITLDILPAWYGTPWDFNGTTRTPGTGTIACGYFVNTVLQDAGFKLPRIKWSQMAAEPITVKLCHRIKRFRDRPVSDVITYIQTQGDGLYKVGLDSHVGFIVARNGIVRFVHSNYYQRDIGVMSEPLDGNNPLAHSRYRIVGSVLGDALVIAWITGQDLNTFDVRSEN
ncbi:MAG: hypothetical protein JNJ91_11210 [Flavobacteriales bacterium]|nr:hypothetical protein [Flavobacteriales bacterium]